MLRVASLFACVSALSPLAAELPLVVLCKPAAAATLASSGCARAVYTVHAARAGASAAALSCGATVAPAGASVHSLTNGVSAQLVELGELAALPFSLPLRAGVNTVELSLPPRLSRCALAVAGALPRPRVGALAPYVELEAEDGVTDGARIGPGFAYYTLPSEASQRRAVQLVAGQFVDFTVPAGMAAANAIAIRFSIPDGAPGTSGGIEATRASRASAPSSFSCRRRARRRRRASWPRAAPGSASTTARARSSRYATRGEWGLD